jgi:anti-anti-sigma regulatory factor
MFDVETDPANQVLKIAFSAAVDVEQAQRCVEEVKVCLNSMPKGYRLLTDLTGLESMETGCAQYIRQAMDLCNKKGVALVVRVIPDPHKDIGFNILSIFHYRRGINIVTVETPSEAMKVLEERLQ